MSHTDITKWSDEAMFQAAPMQRDSLGRVVPQVTLLSATPDPLGVVAAAFRMYAGKPTYSLHDIKDQEREHAWQESLKTHLKAPWEFIDMHFFIEAVTRAFTHQMVRQRTAVYAQESLRFAVKEGLASETPIPPSMANMKKDDPPLSIWNQTIKEIERAYEGLVNAGIPAEDARGLLPHCVTTRLHYKTTFRSLVEHAGNRLCTQAQFEWRMVFTGIMKAIKEFPGGVNQYGEDNNWQFQILASPISQTFTPVCYKAGRCVFMGDIDRKCSIRERANEGRFDEIDPLEWMLDHDAARRDG